MSKATNKRRTSFATDSETLRKLQVLATYERRPITEEVALLIDKRLEELGLNQQVEVAA